MLRAAVAQNCAKKSHVAWRPGPHTACPWPGTVHTSTGRWQPFGPSHGVGAAGCRAASQPFQNDQWRTAFSPSVGLTLVSARPWKMAAATGGVGQIRWPAAS